MSMAAKSTHQVPTRVSRLFFSTSNMNTLQEAMKRIILQKMGHEISRQSDKDLYTIMRNVYLEHGNPKAVDPHREVEELNNVVLRACMPMVASGVQARLAYIRDASQMHVPLERFAFTANKTRELTFPTNQMTTPSTPPPPGLVEGTNYARYT